MSLLVCPDSVDLVLSSSLRSLQFSLSHHLSFFLSLSLVLLSLHSATLDEHGTVIIWTVVELQSVCS